MPAGLTQRTVGGRDLRKALFENYEKLNIEDISIMTQGGGLDLKPYIKL